MPDPQTASGQDGAPAPEGDDIAEAAVNAENEGEGEDDNSLVVMRESDDEGEIVHDETVEHPTRLLRIAHMTRSLLDEVRTADLDEAGRNRLQEIHNKALQSLTGILSEELEDELSDLAPKLAEDATPTGAELRVVQAQLAGWLEGLFRGIQATMASQQRAAQQQLQQMRQQAMQQGPEAGRSGQYL